MKLNKNFYTFVSVFILLFLSKCVVVKGDSSGYTNVSWSPTQWQKYFSPIGNATPVLNSDGSWESVRLTDDKQGQVGGLVFAIPFQMRDTSNPISGYIDFDFRIDQSSGNGPANGFALFVQPQVRNGDQYSSFSSLAGKTTPSMPKNQDMYSLGLPGANMGDSDMVDTSGMIINTRSTDANGWIVANNPNTYYGDITHAWSTDPTRQVYGKIPAVDNYSSKFLLNGCYATTNSITAAPDNDIFNQVFGLNSPWAVPGVLFPNMNPISVSGNITDGKWYHCHFIMGYPEYRIIITDPSTGTTLGDNTVNFQWIFNILTFYNINFLKLTATTGIGSSRQYVKNISGNIRIIPGATIVKQSDTDGNPINSSPQIYPNPNGQVVSEPIHYTKSDGSTWVLSQVNSQVMNADGSANNVHKVTSITNDGTNWSYTLPPNTISNVAFTNVNFIYRRSDSSPNLGITLQKNSIGSATSDMVTLNNGDTVKVNFTLTSPNNGPSPWKGVHAVVIKPNTFSLISSTSDANPISGTSNLDVPLGDILPNQTINISYVLKNNGSTVNFYPGDIGHAAGSNVGHVIFTYDKSSENIDITGTPVNSSYYYVDRTLDAPYGATSTLPDFTTYTDMDPGNYVPRTGASTIHVDPSPTGRTTLRAVPNFDFGVVSMIPSTHQLANSVLSAGSVNKHLNLDFSKDDAGGTGTISDYLNTGDSSKPISRSLVITSASGTKTNNWSISASLGKFTNGTNIISVNVPKLTLKSPKLCQPLDDSGNTNMSSTSGVPTFNNVTLLADGISSKVVADSNNTATSHAIGSWAFDFGNVNSASLDFPSSDIKSSDARNANYHAIITWTLVSNTPDS